MAARARADRLSVERARLRAHLAAGDDAGGGARRHLRADAARGVHIRRSARRRGRCGARAADFRRGPGPGARDRAAAPALRVRRLAACRRTAASGGRARASGSCRRASTSATSGAPTSRARSSMISSRCRGRMRPAAATISPASRISFGRRRRCRFCRSSTPRRLPPSASCCRRGRSSSPGRCAWSSLQTRAAPGIRRGLNSLMVFGERRKSRDALRQDPPRAVRRVSAVPDRRSRSIGLEQLTRWRGGFSVGQSPRPLLNIPGLPPVAGLICYEAIFPAAIVQGDKRPGLLINVTNDGWFGDTTGPWQHFHQARVRAVEEGLPLVRAANNGISAVIDSQGRVNAMLGINARGVLDSNVSGAVATPHYARIGDWTFVALVLVFLLSAIVLARKQSILTEIRKLLERRLVVIKLKLRDAQ